MSKFACIIREIAATEDMVCLHHRHGRKFRHCRLRRFIVREALKIKEKVFVKWLRLASCISF